MNYIYSNADFRQANVLASWPSYPLSTEGDPDHVVYTLRCRVLKSAYRGTVPEENAPMSSAASAGVLSLEMSDPAAIFVGDSGWADAPGGRMEFTRRFATIPKNIVGRLSGSRSHPFPAYKEIYPRKPDTALDLIYGERFARQSNSTPGPVFVDHSYFLLGAPLPPIPDVFQPVLDGTAVDYVSDGGSGTFSGTAADGESVNAAYAISATVPSYSQYAQKITNDDMIVIDAPLQQYLGNIHRLSVYKMRAR